MNRRISLTISTILLVLLCLATVMRSALYIDEATFWSDVAQKSPAKARPLTMLGIQAQNRGDEQAATKYFERAVELQPDYPEALNDLAIIYSRSNKRDQARELLQRAVQRAPRSLTFRSNLAMLYYLNNMQDHAIREYTTIIATAPRSPEAAFARQMLPRIGDATSGGK